MPKYTDDEIRIMKKITCKIAGDYLGISSMAVSIGMRNNLLPIGFAVHNEDRDRTYSESWTYHIIAERLIAYKYGRISEVQVQNIEKNLSTIIQQFEEMKKEPYLYAVTFSDFQMDTMSGHFGGEIRLAYLFDGERVRIVTGGSVNGSINACSGGMKFTTERYDSKNYSGPFAVMLPGVRVAGSLAEQE